MSICVFGSLNIDLIMRSPRFPQPGETLGGHGFEIIPGGKGGNQAIAAARLGSTVHMVGRVGADNFGEQLLVTLQQQNVSTDSIFIDPGIHSGIAMITVADNGENQILLAAGANGKVDESDVKRLIPLLKECRVLLLQLEIPIPSVLAAAQVAHQAGVLVILDPAPVPALFPTELYQYIDVLTPNQTEAAQLVGFSVQSIADAERAALTLQQKGIKHVIVTLGNQGAIALINNILTRIPAFSVTVVDTTAAGDAFNGALAAALDQDQNWPTALRWATAAGAMTSTCFGAQPALPSLEKLKQLLYTHNPVV
jgi:ribokinase